MFEGKRPPNEYVVMEVLSERYGWKPDEIRNMNARDIAAYMDIIGTRNFLANKAYKKNGR